jgi:hypothetical protein
MMFLLPAREKIQLLDKKILITKKKKIMERHSYKK